MRFHSGVEGEFDALRTNKKCTYWTCRDPIVY